MDFQNQKAVWEPSRLDFFGKCCLRIIQPTKQSSDFLLDFLRVRNYFFGSDVN
jgi:hypothetical protein